MFKLGIIINATLTVINTCKKVVLLLTSLIIALQMQGTIFTTISSGDWTNNSIWQNGISPSLTINSNDEIIITTNHEIYINGDLSFNNQCSLTINGSVELNGNLIANNQLILSINGRFVIDGYVEVNNSYSSSITGDLIVTNNLIVRNNASLDITGSLSVYGDFSGDNNNELTGDGKVNIQGSISGLNTDNYTGTIVESYEKGIGLINNGSHIYIGGNDVIFISGASNGNYTNFYEAGRDGSINSDGKIIIEGDWNNYSSDSIFTNINSAGSVEFKGSGLQNLGGSKATQFENLILNNTAGLTIDANIPINESINLQSGSITTGTTDTLIILNRDINSIINCDENKTIIGNLRRYVNTGTYNFPLAADGDYLPAQLEITELGMMSYLSAKFTSSSSETIPLNLKVNGTLINEFLDRGYWTFTPDNETNVEYNITLTSRGHTNGGLYAEQHAILKREESGEWMNVGTHDNSTQSGTGTDPITVTRSNLVNFSDFIIGKSESNPLPIELINFTAACNLDGIAIKWTTLSEINNEKFLLEYSFDGIHYSLLSSIDGQGTTYLTNHYSYLHPIKTSVPIYYQLTQSDFDGTKTTYPAIASICKNSDNEVQVWINTSNEIVYSFFNPLNEKYTLSLVDYLGRLILNNPMQATMGENKHNCQLNKMTSGVYILNLQFNNRIISKIIILN